MYCVDFTEMVSRQKDTVFDRGTKRHTHHVHIRLQFRVKNRLDLKRSRTNTIVIYRITLAVQTRPRTGVGSSYVKLLTWITEELGNMRGPQYGVDAHHERTRPRIGVGSSQLRQTSDMNHWRNRQRARTTVRCQRPSWSVTKSGQLPIFVRYTSSSQPGFYNERLEDLVRPLSLYN